MADDPIAVIISCLRLGMYVEVVFTRHTAGSIHGRYTASVYAKDLIDLWRKGSPKIVLTITEAQATDLADKQASGINSRDRLGTKHIDQNGNEAYDSVFFNLGWTVHL